LAWCQTIPYPRNTAAEARCFFTLIAPLVEFAEQQIWQPPRSPEQLCGLWLRGAGFEPFEEKRRSGFRRLVHFAFGQRRKTLRNALASDLGREKAAEVVAAAGLDERVRAEALGLEEMLRLFAAWRAGAHSVQKAPEDDEPSW